MEASIFICMNVSYLKTTDFSPPFIIFISEITGYKWELTSLLYTWLSPQSPLIFATCRDCPWSPASCRDYCPRIMASCRDCPCDSASCRESQQEAKSHGQSLQEAIYQVQQSWQEARDHGNLRKAKYDGQSLQEVKIRGLVYTLWR